jgi:HK97 family phage prohead protease
MSTSTIERRFTIVAVELRGDSGKRNIGGYAAVFNKLSQNLGGFVEQLAPSAFNKSRGDGWPDVLARFNHEDAGLLGTTNSGTLKLKIDEFGLLYDVDPPTARSDIVELVQRGDVAKSSFAFRVPPGGDEWGTTDQGFPLRTLLSVQLVDVAPVTIPAYLDTTAALRSLADKVGADLDEVRSAAQNDQLARYIVKPTGSGKPAPRAPRTFGPAAAAALEALRVPEVDKAA